MSVRRGVLLRPIQKWSDPSMARADCQQLDTVARMSDRIIDCPVNVTVSAGDCDSTGLP
jgi:hypothetical protein